MMRKKNDNKNSTDYTNEPKQKSFKFRPKIEENKSDSMNKFSNNTEIKDEIEHRKCEKNLGKIGFSFPSEIKNGSH